MSAAFGTTFESYIGPPTTAVALLPLTRLSFRDARGVFRTLILFGFVFAVAASAAALPANSRLRGGTLGALFLCTTFAAPSSFGAGQLDAFVACAYAVGVLAWVRGRPVLSGLSIAAAAVLKVSPALGLVLLAARRSWRAVFWGVGGLTAAAALSILAFPVASIQFATDVAPSLAAGSLGMENQALTGYLARLVSGPADFTNFRTAAGGFAALAPALALAGLLALVRAGRSRAPGPYDISAALIVALLAGPITWTHYAAWALVFAVQLGDVGLWSSRRARRIAGPLVVVGWLLLALPVYVFPSRFAPERFFTKSFSSAHPFVAGLTGVHTAGLLLWFLASIVLSSADRTREPATDVKKGDFGGRTPGGC